MAADTDSGRPHCDVAGMFVRLIGFALALAVLGPSAAANAAVSVRNFRMAHPEARGDGAGIDWRMTNDGEVDLTFSACPMCRNPNPKGYRLTIDRALLQRIDALLPDKLIESATRAPCTLPHAEPGWALTVNVIRSDETGNMAHRGFFLECQSPELEGLRARIAEAAALLLAEIKNQKIPSEVGR